MPFHNTGDDDFSDDVFDQPTRVASLDSLLKHEEEQARAAKAEAEAVTGSTPDPIGLDEGDDDPHQRGRQAGRAL